MQAAPGHSIMTLHRHSFTAPPQRSQAGGTQVFIFCPQHYEDNKEVSVKTWVSSLS